MASLAEMKARLGVVTVKDDAVMQQDLDSADAVCLEGLYATAQDPTTRPPPVDEAILLVACRLYRRRLSPEGVAGWPDIGVFRISTRDPDVDMLLAPYRDMSVAGLA